MKFTPRKARNDVNVSKEHPLVEATTLVAGLGLILAIVLVVLIFLVDVVLYFVPEEKEVALFSSWLPDDIATVAYDDPRLEKLDYLLGRLSRHWPESKYELRVEINDSAEMNALALPGGLIVVTSGLLEKVQTENELAFVLGHELGHFKNRDHIRGMGRGVVIALLFAALSSSEGSSVVGSSIADLTLRGFSRRQESAADRFGLKIVHDEYGHVAETWRFFERISVGDRKSSILGPYLSTHPLSESRIEDIVEYAGANGWSINGDAVPIDW